MPAPAGWFDDGSGRLRWWDGNTWTDTYATTGAWHPDPYGRHEMRYWDGSAWTDDISSQGVQGTDPMTGGSRPTMGQPPKAKIIRQVARAGVSDLETFGGGTILTESVLVVNQKPKLYEVKAEYEVFDRAGRPLGFVREVRQNIIKSTWDRGSSRVTSRRLEITDTQGRVLLALRRPSSMARSNVIVSRSDGSMVGEIYQVKLSPFGKAHFAIGSGGQALGSIRGDNWFDLDFGIQDVNGEEVARISRAGRQRKHSNYSSARGDRYVVEIHRDLAQPFKSLVVASALAIDTALRNNGR